jgi:hypothetical protein
VRRADKLAIFMCRLSCNLGASSSRVHINLSRYVMGLLYFYLYLQLYVCHDAIYPFVLTSIIFRVWRRVKPNSSYKILIAPFYPFFSYLLVFSPYFEIVSSCSRSQVRVVNFSSLGRETKFHTHTHTHTHTHKKSERPACRLLAHTTV